MCYQLNFSINYLHIELNANKILNSLTTNGILEIFKVHKNLCIELKEIYKTEYKLIKKLKTEINIQKNRIILYKLTSVVIFGSG